jgi:hypothetical protein
MELEAAYPAARIVSPKVHAYFTRQRAETGAGNNGNAATLPDTATIQAIVDAAFWASLRREEGFVPKVSLAFLSPEETNNALLFERPLPLDPSILTKVAPAVERPGIHLGVWHAADGLVVWGATRKIPSLCFVVEVAAPGLIVIKHHSSETTGKFINVAVLEGDQVKMVDERAAAIPDCPALLTALLGSESPASWVHSVNVLVQLAVSMRAHGRGGSLLVVPAIGDAWRESIVSPIPYAASPPFSALADLVRASATAPTPASINDTSRLGRTVDAVAGLTAVDGAVVLTDQYDVLGFGAKITRRRGHNLVEQVMVTEPIEGGVATLVPPDKLGGTRHLSAAQFVQDQHNCAALIASQDGRFTVFEWSACENMVHAHRIEALLL